MATAKERTQRLSGTRLRRGLLSAKTVVLLVPLIWACAAHPKTKPTPAPAPAPAPAPDTAAPPPKEASETFAGSVGRCERDMDCMIVSFDCSECGTCPGDAPPAMTPAQLEAMERECRQNPPARLDPDAFKNGRPFPACSPCLGSTFENQRPVYRAVCHDHACRAEIERMEAVSGAAAVPTSGQ